MVTMVTDKIITVKPGKSRVDLKREYMTVVVKTLLILFLLAIGGLVSWVILR